MISEGILLIDKPKAITSHDVVDAVRKKLKVKKVGHTGTLDPLATGLLIILVGRQNTKKQALFLKKDKQYHVTIKLGVETDTYDSDGQVQKLASPDSLKKVTKQKLATVLKKFQGDINQTVPPFSAVKIKGKKLYQLARQNIPIKSLPIRTVTIKNIQILGFNRPTHEAELSVDCSSGTYIRSLAHDIGQALGVGAHVTQLRRTKIGDFSVKQAILLEKVPKSVNL